MNDESPVIQLLRIVWRNAQTRGRLQYYHAMQDAIRLAILGGIAFKPDDFITMERTFVFGWRGACWMPNAENIYHLSVHGGHRDFGHCYPSRSACIAIEKWQGWKPFIVQGRRLSLYSEVRHPKHGKLWVTSLDVEKIGACWYDNPGNHQLGTPAKRYTFTHKTIKSEGLT